MQTIYKEEQIDAVSSKLNLPRTTVKSIIELYVDTLGDDILSGKTVKVFNICYLRVKSELGNEERKTLAYISTEIGKKLSVGGVTVLRVLEFFEDQIVEELQSGNGVTIRGLIRIQPCDENSTKCVRIRKTTSYNSAPVYVSTLGSFKRRVLNGG